ncbi:MAG: hypothetical protein JW702_04995 [Clostridiales bacterium]|nr:hypothetical protein [Clostridiales bacterium]
MNKMVRFNIYHLFLWLFVGAGFIAVFVGMDAINNWGDNAIKSIFLGLLFVIGFGGEAILRYKFRIKKEESLIGNQEELIRLRSMEYSFIATVLYVFLLTISIYIMYEAEGNVPVGWLWFIAYSLVVVVNITSSSMILLTYRKQKKHFI